MQFLKKLFTNKEKKTMCIMRKLVTSFLILTMIFACQTSPKYFYRNFAIGEAHVSKLNHLVVAETELAAAAQASEKYFGLVPDGMVIIDPRTEVKYNGSASIVLTWTFYENDFPISNTAIRHEFGHFIFISSFYPNSSKYQYGGDAPDWLDEMAALAFETAEEKANRLSIAKQNAMAAKFIQLRTLLNMPHPGPVLDPSVNAETVDIENDEAQTVIVYGPDNDVDIIFEYYAQISSLLQYMIYRTNNEKIITDFVRLTRNGHGQEQALLSIVEAGSLEDFEADFLQWLKTLEGN